MFKWLAGAVGITALTLFLLNNTTQTGKEGDILVLSPSVKITNTLDVASGELKIKRLKYDESRIVDFNTDVNELSVNAAMARLQELDNGQPILLRLDSPGGSVFDGARLITLMESMDSRVDTIVDGMCASMCAIIHQHGVQRYMTNRSQLMFHPASGGVQGQVPNMLSRLGAVDKIIKRFEAYILARSSMTRAAYNELVSYELWVDAIDAKQHGFIDDVAFIKKTSLTTSPTITNTIGKRKLWGDIQLGL